MADMLVDKHASYIETYRRMKVRIFSNVNHGIYEANNLT